MNSKGSLSKMTDMSTEKHFTPEVSLEYCTKSSKTHCG